ALMGAFLEVPIVGAVLFMAANTVGFYLSFRHYRPPEEESTDHLPPEEERADHLPPEEASTDVAQRSARYS
ncbi:MAG: hypothetical protein ACRDZ6_13020, partial [Acidimicrobiales bacterium]